MKKSVMKASIAVIAAAMLGLGALTLTGCGSDASNANANTPATSNMSNANATNTTATNTEADSDVVTAVDLNSPYSSGQHTVVMTVDGYDPVTITLDADAAPVTVSNFMNLVENGYYDGLAFYRFQDGFCLQGGTAGNGAAAMDPSLKPIIGEFSENGIENPLADDFKKGTVAMARTNDPDSATSTFFVTLDSSDGVSLSLDGRYAAFGMIDDAGMEVIDKLVADHANVKKDAMGIVGDDDLAYITSIEIVN